MKASIERLNDTVKFFYGVLIVGKRLREKFSQLERVKSSWDVGRNFQTRFGQMPEK